MIAYDSQQRLGEQQTRYLISSSRDEEDIVCQIQTTCVNENEKSTEKITVGPFDDIQNGNDKKKTLDNSQKMIKAMVLYNFCFIFTEKDKKSVRNDTRGEVEVSPV